MTTFSLYYIPDTMLSPARPLDHSDPNMTMNIGTWTTIKYHNCPICVSFNEMVN